MSIERGRVPDPPGRAAASRRRRQFLQGMRPLTTTGAAERLDVVPLRRRARDAVVFSGRYATASRRSLPDFIIIGAQRASTTSLYRWLTAHPDVVPAWCKEVHYFDNYDDRTLRWYRAHFPFPRPGRLTGESSPSLLLHPLAPRRAAEDLPTTKFIALLREPVERAISNHWLRRRNGVAPQDESFEAALQREAEIADRDGQPIVRGEPSLLHLHYSYVARGEYAPQLRRWFGAVGRERVLVVESERLGTQPGEAARILAWLGLPDWDEPFPAANHAERVEEASPTTVARLRAHFEPFNLDLFELLGREMWEQSPTPRAGAS